MAFRMLMGCALLLSAGACEWRSDWNVAQDVQALRDAAQKGDAASQAKLGDWYYLGQGVPRDYTEAAKWFRKAAEQGNADAQFSLGLICENGEGLPQNYTEALTWFRKAAERGHAEAQASVARVAPYAAEQGVRPSLGRKLTSSPATQPQSEKQVSSEPAPAPLSSFERELRSGERLEKYIREGFFMTTWFSSIGAVLVDKDTAIAHIKVAIKPSSPMYEIYREVAAGVCSCLLGFVAQTPELTYVRVIDSENRAVIDTRFGGCK